VDVHRIAAARDELAAACWASEVLVERHPRYANIVALLVVRRPSTEDGQR
jgi:hypothetical protein